MELTMNKYLELEEQLDAQRQHLKQVQVQLDEAVSKGDLRENEEYAAARSEFEFTQNKISELEIKISEAEIVQYDNGPLIRIGSRVRVTRVTKDDEPLDESRQFEVAAEGDTITKGILGISSPLGREILNGSSGVYFVHSNDGTYFRVEKLTAAN